MRFLLASVLLIGLPMLTSMQPPSFQAPTTETKGTDAATPEVTAVDPPRAAAGSATSLKITGKNFAEGVKVSFSNPGIRVLESSSTKSTELTARIQITTDASTGTGSLFVVNPGDLEAEFPFEVTARESGTRETQTSGPAATETSSSKAQRFEVYNVGEVVSIFKSPNKPKGALVLNGGKLAFEEGGKEAFSVPLTDIKEVDINNILGLNTGTFHLILKSGKMYNFVAASLRAADTQSIVDSLRSALP
jgi:quinohemoprotein amine dehydrogenase alpha subunit-like protein